MSLDRPFYDELRRRGHSAARFWLVGDLLYYLGLVGAVVLPIALWVVLAIMGFPIWKQALVSCVAALLGAIAFLCGVALKRRSYLMAAKDGIQVNDY